METITSAPEIDRLFRAGRRARRTTMIVLEGPTPAGRSPSGRIVYVAGRKLGSAVERNRCKRVLREAVRRSGSMWPGRDVALIATTRTAHARPAQLESDLVTALAEVRETT